LTGRGLRRQHCTAGMAFSFIGHMSDSSGLDEPVSSCVLHTSSAGTALRVRRPYGHG
jgi:hypothetical protein